MTDPLRPFTQAVRAMWTARRRAPAEKMTSGSEQAQTSGTTDTLLSHLQTRLATLANPDAAKMRNTFVKTVLLWELGDHLGSDPGLAEVVADVSDQIAADPAVGARLHTLLLKLSDKR